MLARLNSAARTAVMASIGLWTFGFLMVLSVLYVPGGRSVLPTLLSQIPIFFVAVACSLGIFGVFHMTRDSRVFARWTWIIAACVAAALATGLADVLLTDWTARTFVHEWLSWATFSMKRFRSLFIFYVWPFAANVALFWAISANDRSRRLERRAAEAEAARQQAHLSALRLQLNPHFLFNTLNTISALVAQRESEEARAMIGRLADFLRASLATDTATFSPALRPVTLAVHARREGEHLVLEVADDGEGPGRVAPVSAGGYGLANVRARLAALYGARGMLDAHATNPGFRARIRLPLTRSQELTDGAAPLEAIH